MSGKKKHREEQRDIMSRERNSKRTGYREGKREGMLEEGTQRGTEEKKRHDERKEWGEGKIKGVLEGYSDAAVGRGILREEKAMVRGRDMGKKREVGYYRDSLTREGTEV